MLPYCPYLCNFTNDALCGHPITRTDTGYLEAEKAFRIREVLAAALGQRNEEEVVQEAKVAYSVVLLPSNFQLL